MQKYLLIFLLIASPAVQAYGNRDNPLGSPLTTETLSPHHTPPKSINMAELLMKRGLASKEQVSDEILATMGIKSGLSFAGKRIRLGQLPIEDADLYQKVQEKIALSIPDEYERPILDIIFLTSDAVPLTADRTIGVVGGTGPLSDASVMHGLGERFKIDRQALSHHLHLLSMPPPRRVLDQALGGLAYVKRLIKFRRLSYKTYLLASNTAHVNYDNFARIVGDEYAFNMVQHIADKVQHLMQENATAANQELLIFGTTQAWEARLYPKLFKKRGIKTISPSHDDQALVQEYIDQVKAGRNSPEAIAAFMQVFHKYYRNTQQSVIFACTELPLGLQEHIAAESTANPPTFAGAPLYDTEALMIEALWSLAAAGGV